MKFVESNSGLFYFETNNNGKNKESVTDYTLGLVQPKISPTLSFSGMY